MPITYQEMLAWCQLCDIQLTVVEQQAIKAVDVIFINHVNKKRAPSKRAAEPDEQNMIPGSDSDGIRMLFRSINVRRQMQDG